MSKKLSRWNGNVSEIKSVIEAGADFKEFYAELVKAYDSLDDPYSYFVPPENNAPLSEPEVDIRELKTAFDILDMQNGIFYVRLQQFDDNALERLRLAFLQDPEKGFVFDMRHNPGGYFIDAIEISDFLVMQGGAVQTFDGKKYSSYPTSDDRLTSKPIALIIDEYCASACDLVAAALKDHNRAKIFGRKSFGKGIGQLISPLPLNVGYAQVTNFEFVSPITKSFIHGVGVRPHVVIESGTPFGDLVRTNNLATPADAFYVTAEQWLLNGGLP